MLVDAHHHLWNLADGGYTWLDAPELAPIRRTFTPADLRVELAAAGVDRSVLVEGGRCDVREAPILLGHAARFAEIGAVVAWADPGGAGSGRGAGRVRGRAGRCQARRGARAGAGRGPGLTWTAPTCAGG